MHFKHVFVRIEVICNTKDSKVWLWHCLALFVSVLQNYFNQFVSITIEPAMDNQPSDTLGIQNGTDGENRLKFLYVNCLTPTARGSTF